MAHPAAQLRVKGSSKPNLLGKAGSVPVIKPMKRFLTEQERDPQPGMLHGVALHLVNLPGRHAPGLDAADAVAMQKIIQLLHVHKLHVAVFVPAGKIVAVVLVGLQDHFPQSHSVQQIGNPDVNIQAWIFIIFHGISFLSRDYPTTSTWGSKHCSRRASIAFSGSCSFVSHRL